MKRFFVILVTIIFSVCIACGDAPNAPIDLNSQQYYFELEYVNHAWGYDHHGYIIESSGEIYEYTIGNVAHPEYVWTPDPNGVYSPAELAEKFSWSRKKAGEIGQSALRDKASLIETAAGGQFSDPEFPMADFGLLKYKCYTYDQENDTYREILLRQEGDCCYINLSVEAIMLAGWLEATFGEVSFLPSMFSMQNSGSAGSSDKH